MQQIHFFKSLFKVYKQRRITSKSLRIVVLNGFFFLMIGVPRHQRNFFFLGSHIVVKHYLLYMLRLDAGHTSSSIMPHLDI